VSGAKGGRGRDGDTSGEENGEERECLAVSRFQGERSTLDAERPVSNSELSIGR